MKNATPLAVISLAFVLVFYVNLFEDSFIYFFHLILKAASCVTIATCFFFSVLILEHNGCGNTRKEDQSFAL